VKVYVASPLGFADSGRHFYYRRLLPALRRGGHDVVDPWALPSGRAIARARRRPYGRARRNALKVANAEAARGNQRAIDRADAVLAVLDGADVDSGTAAEIGYACARGKAIVGYRGDVRPAGDNDGAVVNLQVEYFIRASGGTIVRRLADVRRALAALRRGGRARRSGRASSSRRTR
jgi:nucleoside 2-deoxyribosyltransferase